MRRLGKTRANVAVLLLVVGALPAAADWTQFRGDAALTGVATDALPAAPALAWTFEAGEEVQSTPAIAGGTVYVGSKDGRLYALDLATGKQRFRYEAGAEIRSSPAVRGGVVYVGDEGGTFHAVDVRTGARRWAFKAGGAVTSSPNFAVDGDHTRALFGSYDNFLYAVDAKSGKLAWKLETESYVHATPAIAGGVVYAAGCDGFLRAVRAADGREVGKLALGGYAAASPAIAAGRAFVGTFQNEVLAIDLDRLAVAWRFKDAAHDFPFYASPAVASASVVVAGRDKRVRALDAKTGKERWSFATPARVDASPVIAGDRVVAASLSGDLYVLSLATGKQLWHYAAGAPLAASPSVGGGYLVVATTSGTVLALGPKKTGPQPRQRNSVKGSR
ncbi:MAG TPA: PQQ-binding-like beta-propeller repeat protein [Thermoanaerobaculia bacterium]|nr:PQQ-binding-like beta-propeller repeat protein [Thermoanaerobaculia bacterium]